MPTYEYACRSCGQHLEVVQSFRDDPLTTCPACEGELRKVFSPAGIIFKGSGWHIKDYATSSKADKAGSETASDSKSESESASSKDSSKDSSSADSSAKGSSSKDSGSTAKGEAKSA